MNELIRTCKFRPYRKGLYPTFTLQLFDTGKVGYDQKYIVGYKLKMHLSRHKTIILFESQTDFRCSPLDVIDSNETVKCLMGFLTLRQGDIDKEYFDNYTKEQLEFSELHAESLNIAVYNRFGYDD
jgi:hypothetical protein